MANIQQLVNVAQQCNGYSPIDSGITSSSAVGVENCRSCTTCNNFKNSKCQENLFDKVLAGYDEK